MMISSATAGAPTAAPVRASGASAADAPDPSSATDDASPSDASPDVVVTLSGGARPAASTYDATGRLPGGSSLNDLGANGPTSLAHATEAVASGDDADTDGDRDEDADSANASAPAPDAVAA